MIVREEGKWGWKPRWGPTVRGFMNCRGWWSREVDIKLTLQKLKLDVLGTFLREEEEASVAGYVWYGHNREGCK